MNIKIPLFLTLGAICGLAAPSAVFAGYVPPSSNRMSFNFNYDWKFIKQDVAGASNTVFNDSAWQSVSLPHTYTDNKFREWIAFSNDHPVESVYYGKTWYRKHFTVDAAYAGRKILIEFQGIDLIGTFYVNGQYAGLHENGVGPCGLDITNFVNFGGDNVIAVQVNNDPNYTTVQYGVKLPYGQPFNPNFGGLTRDATLYITDRVHATLPLYRNLGTVGTYVFPTKIDTLNQTAGLAIQAEVANDYAAPQAVSCDAVVVDRDGNEVLSESSVPQTIAAGQKFVFNLTGNMTGVHFWAPDYPYLYTVYVITKVNGTPVDVSTVPLGIRHIIFSSQFGLEINGHPVYLKGYAPRESMEWPCVGKPVDWMNELDFKMMKDSNANFCRPMHIAPRKTEVEAADKFGVVMVCPAANNEGDDTDPNIWQERLDDMRDVTIYFRNDPSVVFYEGCNQILTAQHMTDMKNIRLTWDPNGNRFAGLRSNDTNVTAGIREYSASMDITDYQLATPLWDAEYARGESPRRVWDEYTPMLNPRWNGTDPATKYITGGYFYIASDYHQAFGLNSGLGDFIGDYLQASPSQGGHAYFRLQSSEDMVLENLAKYYGRFERSVMVQPTSVSTTKGVNVGGAKIIWSDSVTDGRMHDMEVARVSGAVDGARLPKEVYYAMQVAQSDRPQVYIVGHWNYPSGTTKRVYVVSNTAQVRLQTFNPAGQLLTDYGLGTNSFFPAALFPSGGDEVNHYVFAFDNVAWQPGTIKATGYDASGAVVAIHSKSTAGAPVALKLTPIVGPSGQFLADGSDIAMFDAEVVDANGNRCPTYENSVSFTCSGNGIFLGGYNSGRRYSTNLTNLTSGYSLNVECGINRVFVRSTRTAGPFTLNVSASGLSPATSTITSAPIVVTNGLSAEWPQTYLVTLGAEPTPVQEGTVVPPPPPPPPPAAATDITDLAYSGANTGATLVTNVQPGVQIYKDRTFVFGTLPGYLAGGEFIQPFQSDAGETSSTDQYQFNLSRFSYVYLAIDAANGMPANNNNASYEWQQLPETIAVNGRTMNIFRSRIMGAYENVYLAANGTGSTPFDPNSNMYLVFAVSIEQPLQKPGQTVTASSVQTGNVPGNAIDGNPTTRWTASDGTFPQWIKIDLGQECEIGGYILNWFSNATRSYQYKIEVSNDDLTYNLSVDQETNTATGQHEDRVPAIGAYIGRYVKITVTGGGGWASIVDLTINGIVSASSVPSQAAAPAFSPGTGTYSSAQTVTISTTTNGAAIHYTSDGSMPTSTSSLVYSGPVTVSATTTLKAIASASGMTDSAVSSATYTIGTPPPPTRIFINAGGAAVGNFAADTDFTGGAAKTISATIDLSLLAAPVPPQTVFQSYRYNSSTYTIPGLAIGHTYTVGLLFAETNFSGAGKRLFNVNINGTRVLTNFDIFQAAGGAGKGIRKTFPATAGASGQIVIQFTNGTADVAKINGIEIQ